MDEFKNNSRRSVLLSLNGSVACADPRAAEIGLGEWVFNAMPATRAIFMARLA